MPEDTEQNGRKSFPFLYALSLFILSSFYFLIICGVFFFFLSDCNIADFPQMPGVLGCPFPFMSESLEKWLKVLCLFTGLSSCWLSLQGPQDDVAFSLGTFQVSGTLSAEWCSFPREDSFSCLYVLSVKNEDFPLIARFSLACLTPILSVTSCP